MFFPNQQIGLYKLIHRLGRGGFGEVWLAERKTQILTTKVAVKLPLDDQIDIETIKQEAELWEHASGHPNVLPIIEADIYDGQVLIVSEFAPDGSLADWLKKHGKMSIEEAIETTIKILDGLEFLHSKRIIHRDLKPANILLQGNMPRLADFGISRALRTTATSQTQNVSGTFAYMPPEAFDGKRNEQTDIWAVGVNLYQFLTGRLPYPQVEATTLIAAIMMNGPAPLPDFVPQSVKAVLARALAKNTAERYKSAREMREDLRNGLHKEPQVSVPQISATAEQETITRPISPQPLSQTPRKAKSLLYIGIAVLGLFAAVGGAGLFFNRNNPNRETTQPHNQKDDVGRNSISNTSQNTNLPKTNSTTRPSPNTQSNSSNTKVSTDIQNNSISQDATGSPSPKPVNDFSKYIGKYAFNIKSDADIKTRLKIIMKRNYNRFSQNLTVCIPFTKKGNYLVASCCAPHLCGDEMSFVALDLSKNTLHCALMSKSLPGNVEYFSESGIIPPVLMSEVAKVIAENK